MYGKFGIFSLSDLCSFMAKGRPAFSSDEFLAAMSFECKAFASLECHGRRLECNGKGTLKARTSGVE